MTWPGKWWTFLRRVPVTHNLRAEAARLEGLLQQALLRAETAEGRVHDLKMMVDYVSRISSGRAVFALASNAEEPVDDGKVVSPFPRPRLGRDVVREKTREAMTEFYDAIGGKQTA